MAATVDMQRHDRSLVLVYRNDPRGYMNADGARQLALAVEAAAVEPDIATIILTGGTEGVFVRHYDVSEIIAAGEALRSGRIGLEAMAGGPFASLVDAVAAAPKPVIAAINGTCMGGGFELALACDLRIVAPDVAQIGLPETRLGIFPGGGGTQRLPRLIGEARALEFILKGEVVDAPSAHALGLVHEIAASPIDRALELGALFASRPPEGLATAKALVRSALGHSITSGLIEERTSFGRVLQQSDGAMAAMASFCATGEDITRTA